MEGHITVRVAVPRSQSYEVGSAIRKLNNFGFPITYNSVDRLWTITGTKDALDLLCQWAEGRLR